MTQQHRTPASARFDQRAKRPQPRALTRQATFIDIGKPLARAHEIFRPPEHLGNRRITITPGTAGFLIIGLDRLGQPGMDDKADIGLVDAHAECDRRHNDDAVFPLES